MLTDKPWVLLKRAHWGMLSPGEGPAPASAAHHRHRAACPHDRQWLLADPQAALATTADPSPALSLLCYPAAIFCAPSARLLENSSPL